MNDMAAGHCGPQHRLSFETLPPTFHRLPNTLLLFLRVNPSRITTQLLEVHTPIFSYEKGLKWQLQTVPMDWFRFSDSRDLKARQNIQDPSDPTHWTLGRPPGKNSERQRTLPSTRDRSVLRVPATDLMRFHVVNQKGDRDGNKQGHRPISRRPHARQTFVYEQLTINLCNLCIKRLRTDWFGIYEKPIYGKLRIRIPNACEHSAEASKPQAWKTFPRWRPNTVQETLL